MSTEGAGRLDPQDVDGLLAAADAAIAEGRALEMIDELAAAARHNPDPRLEHCVVEVRHAAFAELDLAPGRPTWPLELADPFPDEDGLPEIDGGGLTGDLLGGAIVHHGCLRVNGLLDEAQVDHLRESIERSFVARDALADGGSLESAVPWLVPFARGREKAEGFGRQAFIRVVDSPRAMGDLVDVFTETGVRGAVTEYFGERPAMIANKWVLRKTPSGKIGTDFHQDGAFLGEGIRTVDCWIALSDCGPGTGRPGVDLIARRFPLLTSGEDAAFSWSLTEESVRAAAPDAAVLAPVFAPGDALFFDERLPHRTSVGLDLTTRYAIESWFVAPSSYPAKHVPVVL